jgi:hypothetical protein
MSEKGKGCEPDMSPKSAGAVSKGFYTGGLIWFRGGNGLPLVGVTLGRQKLDPKVIEVDAECVPGPWELTVLHLSAIAFFKPTLAFPFTVAILLGAFLHRASSLLSRLAGELRCEFRPHRVASWTSIRSTSPQILLGVTSIQCQNTPNEIARASRVELHNLYSLRLGLVSIPGLSNQIIGCHFTIPDKLWSMHGQVGYWQLSIVLLLVFVNLSFLCLQKVTPLQDANENAVFI